MGRTRLLLHGRVSATGGVFGVPINTVAPYFVADPLTPGTPVSSVIVGQRQFINPGAFTDSPTSYDWTVKDNVTGTVIDGDTGMLAAGDDYWTPSDEHGGLTVRLETVAHNASGDSATASVTKAIQAIDLSAAAPALTRTSSSGASPYTVTQSAFASSVYEGYSVQRVIATANDVELSTGEFEVANRVYDETLPIDSSLSPGSLAWPAFDDSGYPRLYEQRRIIAVTPAGNDALSPWSNVVRKNDGPVNSTAYSKYRVRTTNTGNGFATIIAEIAIAATEGGSNTVNNSGVAIGGTAPDVNGAPSKARDGNPVTYYSCNLDAPNSIAFPHDLILDYSSGTPIAANQFSITAQGASGAPSNFTFDGWNGSAWITLKTRTGVTWTDGETKTYVL